MGGYPTVPGGLAAARMGVPLLIHQSDAVAGLANRMLARFANRYSPASRGSLPSMATATWSPEIRSARSSPTSPILQRGLLVVPGHWRCC